MCFSDTRPGREGNPGILIAESESCAKYLADRKLAISAPASLRDSSSPGTKKVGIHFPQQSVLDFLAACFLNGLDSSKGRFSIWELLGVGLPPGVCARSA